MVDEENIFVLIKGDLLIRHGFAVRSWLANSTSHAGEGFFKRPDLPINPNLFSSLKEMCLCVI